MTARCQCHRPVPASSACKCCCAEHEFEAEVNAGPIVDNASTRLYAIGQLEPESGCWECGRDLDEPGLCFDCDTEADYVGGFAPGRRFRA